MICRLAFLLIFVSSQLKAFEMNLNIEIGFEQLLYLVKQLPSKQRQQLVEAIQKAETKPPQANNPVEHSKIWNETAASQFLNGYSEADSIYDKI